jgi:tripartite ATP-independent transporter DctM subunit
MTMSAGPIMASGTLAMLIPPSAVAVLLGSIGDISIGALLIGGILPGLVMATFFASYIIVRCYLDPSLAPVYELEQLPSWATRLRMLTVDVIPLTIIILLVVGLIFFGVATPTESAALGAVGAFILVILYRRMNKQVLLDTTKGTLRITGMILLIFACAAGFSQLLAFTGATSQLIAFVTSWNLPLTAIVVLMLGLVVVMGSFLDQNSIMLITLPLFMPVVENLGINPVWFGIMMLVSLDLGNLTPPFGFSLFILKGVSPSDVTMGQIYRAAVPFIFIELLIVALVLIIPSLATWLPNISGA